MPTRFNCPGCGTVYNFPDEFLGRRARCKKCSEVFTVPKPGPSPDEPMDVLPVDEAEDVPAATAPDALQTRPDPVDRPRPRPAPVPAVPPRSRPVPAAPVQQQRPVWPWVVGGLAAAFVLLAGFGTVLFVALTMDKGPPQVVKVGPPAFKPVDAAPKIPRFEGKQIEPQRFEPKLPPEPVERRPAPAPRAPVDPPPPQEPPPAVKPPEPPQAKLLDLPPVAPLDIRPAALDAHKVVRQLPSTFAEVAVGGGGRYLIFHLPQIQKIAIFDANEGRVTKFLPAPAEAVRIAAGRDKLLVVLPDSKMVQRWDLATGTREVTASLDVPGPVKHVGMGSASNGPLLVGNSTFVDIRTLKQVDLPQRATANTFGFANPGNDPVRVSADGKVFGTWSPATSQGLHSLTVRGDELEAYHSHRAIGQVVPGPDGRVLYTARGRFTRELQPLGEVDSNHAPFCVPALHGDLWLVVPVGRPGERGDPGPLEVHRGDDTRSLVNLPDVELPKDINHWAREPITVDQRLLLIPDAKLLVTLPVTNDRLVLHRFDVDSAMDKAGIDFLYVSSKPPAAAQRGARFLYRIDIKSKRGGVQCKLESGPPGMRAMKSGLLIWSVPPDFEPTSVDVGVSVTDSTGQQVSHNFKLPITSGPVANLPGAATSKEAAAPERPSRRNRSEPKPDDGAPAMPAATVRPSARPPAPLDIKPPEFPGDKLVVPLSSPVTDVAVGGGGRYLVLKTPGERKLAVFDVNAGKVAYTVPVSSPEALFAAGRDKLVVVLPGEKVIQRWDLPSGKREIALVLNLRDPPSKICMGSASNGPVFVATKDRFRGEQTFLDLQTLQAIDFTREKQRGMPPSNASEVRASADGSVFTQMCTDRSPGGLWSCVIEGNRVNLYYRHKTVGVLIPGPDGRTIYGSGGPRTNQLNEIGSTPQESFEVPSIPSQNGPFYLAPKGLPTLSLFGRQVWTGRQEPEGSLGLSLHLEGVDQPLLTLGELEGYEKPRKLDLAGIADDTGMPLDKRIHLIPDAKVLVLIPKTGDKLILHRVDVDQALEKSGVDYFFVRSQPPAQARKGSAYRYPIVAKSKQGGVKFTPASAPPGTTISGDGVLEWSVPADFGEAEANFMVSLRDNSGKEIFHTFRVAVAAAGAAAADGPKDNPPPSRPVVEKPAPPAAPPPNKPAGDDGRVQQERGTLVLQEPLADLTVGCGGKYLILHIPKHKKLVLFDTASRRLTLAVPAPDDDVRFAAGEELLMVLLPGSGVLQRYNLKTFKREAVVPFPVEEQPDLTMGSSSRGPLLVSDRKGARLRFVDPATMKVIDAKWQPETTIGGEHAFLRASAEGTLFACRGGPGGEPHTAYTFDLHRQYATVHTLSPGPGSLVVPSADGRYVHTEEGIFDGDLNRSRREGTGQRTITLPAVTGSMFMKIEPSTRDSLPGTEFAMGELSFYLRGCDRPLAVLNQVVGGIGLSNSYRPPPERLTFDKRFHFLPEAKLVLLVPNSNDRLLFYRFDPVEALEKADFDYPVVTSDAPQGLRKGGTFEYRMAVRSKQGGVKCKLESGPDGMTVSPEGVVKWTVPDDFLVGETQVTVTVSDKSRHDVPHTFRLSVSDKPAP